MMYEALQALYLQRLQGLLPPKRFWDGQILGLGIPELIDKHKGAAAKLVEGM
ncbi:MAG: hypothetical protein PQJ59_14565 [Spirochaetales bacterium]|nr:hypothetical protein [Spirochaetales bacterium]